MLNYAKSQFKTRQKPVNNFMKDGQCVFNMSIQTDERTAARLDYAVEHYYSQNASPSLDSAVLILNSVFNNNHDDDICAKSKLQMEMILKNLQVIFDAHKLTPFDIIKFFGETDVSILSERDRIFKLINDSTLSKISEFFNVNLSWLLNNAAYPVKTNEIRWYKQPEYFCKEVFKKTRRHEGAPDSILFVTNTDINATLNSKPSNFAVHGCLMGIITCYEHQTLTRSPYYTYKVWSADDWCYFKTRDDMRKIMAHCIVNDLSTELIALDPYEFGKVFRGETFFQSQKNCDADVSSIISNDELKSEKIQDFFQNLKFYEKCDMI